MQTIAPGGVPPKPWAGGQGTEPLRAGTHGASRGVPPVCSDGGADPADGRGAPGHKVLLVDDHDLMRLGIRALVETDAAAIHWLEAASLADAMQLYAEHSDIALVLLDLNLADCKGLQGLSHLLGRHPAARVVILSGTQDEFVVRQAKTMGALGYLYKAAAPAYARALLLGALGIAAPDAGTDTSVASRFPRFAAPSSYDRVAELGARHLGILELVLSGCTNQEISTELKLSLGTVKNYVSAILLALDVKSRAHLISLFS